MHETPSIRYRTAAVFAVSIILLASLALGATAGTVEPTNVEGIWYDDTGKGAVELHRCGPALCGHIVWLRTPVNRAGKPLTDRLNPSAQRRHRPICGLQVIGQLALQSNGIWDQGWIYDPKKGKAYDVMIKLKSARQLVVTGYLGVKFLSESYVWHRAPINLKRCGT